MIPCIAGPGSRLYVEAESEALSDGAEYSFTSNDSITAAPSVEFLGGLDGVIDSGTVDALFTRTNWKRLGGSGTACAWKWKTDRTRNRSRCLRYSGIEQGDPTISWGTHQFDTGASGWTEIYLSMNYYWEIDPDFNGVQWKMFRYETNEDMDGDPQVVDGNPPSGYWSNSTARDNSPWSQFTSNGAGGYNQAAYNTSDNGGTDAAPQNQWTRLEFFMRENSTTSATDGIGWLKFTLADGSTFQEHLTTNRVYRNSNDISDTFRYLILQNYFGNGPATSNGRDDGDTLINFDDIYISWAAPSDTSCLRRVEISDGVSEPVIQPFAASGNSGTSRRIVLNKGHLTSFSGCTLREYSDRTTVVTEIEL